jgi:hypothetical protein
VCNQRLKEMARTGTVDRNRVSVAKYAVSSSLAFNGKLLSFIIRDILWMSRNVSDHTFRTSPFCAGVTGHPSLRRHFHWNSENFCTISFSRAEADGQHCAISFSGAEEPGNPCTNQVLNSSSTWPTLHHQFLERVSSLHLQHNAYQMPLLILIISTDVSRVLETITTPYATTVVCNNIYCKAQIDGCPRKMNWLQLLLKQDS